jgi:hypothetical protein
LKLLVSARDAGSAGHIAAIVRYAESQERCSVAVYADGAAYLYLREVHGATRGTTIGHVDSPGDEDRQLLLDAANDIIRREAPDAVIVGVSHRNEAGIDEALLCAAGDIPTFAMQDYWGDANNALGALADVYFTIDDEAAAITLARHGATSVSVGSPKHEDYARLNPLEVRNAWRAMNGDQKSLVVGVFGQDLLRFAGYRKTLKTLASALKRRQNDALIFYRPHPRESNLSRSESLSLLSSEGADVLYADSGTTERWLMISDLVVSAFSSCNYDAAFLNRFSPSPLAATAYLLMTPDVRDFYFDVSGLEVPPPVRLGICDLVTEESDLERVLERAKNGSLAFDCWSAARSLPNPRNASKLIYETVEAAVRRGGRAPLASRA